MFTRQSLSACTPFLAVVLLALVTCSVAGAEKGDGSFEAYGGYLYIGDLDYDGELTYGLRGGYQATDSFGLELSAGRLDAFDELTFVDLSLVWYAKPRGRSQFMAFGGPGGAFLRAGGFSDEAWTAHVGVATKFSFGNHFYLRPDARARWIDGADKLDLEATVSLGFKF